MPPGKKPRNLAGRYGNTAALVMNGGGARCAAAMRRSIVADRNTARESFVVIPFPGERVARHPCYAVAHFGRLDCRTTFLPALIHIKSLACRRLLAQDRDLLMPLAKETLDQILQADGAIRTSGRYRAGFRAGHYAWLDRGTLGHRWSPRFVKQPRHNSREGRDCSHRSGLTLEAIASGP